MAFAGWGTFFAAIAGPVARRVLATLGIGMISYASLTVVQTQIEAAVAAGWSGLPADLYQMCAIFGFVDAVQYWLTAIAVVVTWLAVSRLGAVAS